MKKSFVWFIVCTAVFGWARLSMEPDYRGKMYRFLPNGEWESFVYPLEFHTENSQVSVEIEMHLPPLHPTRFRIIPDNCLQKLWINNTEVYSEHFPICDYEHGEVFDLSPYVHTGKNILKAEIQNYNREGGLEIRTSLLDRTFLPLFLLYIGSILYGVGAVVKQMHLKRRTSVLLTVFFGGAFIRIVYALNTPYSLRAHDYDGHIEYILYLLNNLSLPPAQGGWEYYQPPLYYIFTALILYPAHLLGADKVMLLYAAQIIACMLSIIALAFGIWIAHMVFSTPKQQLEAYCTASILCVLPGLVFAASRISNDTMLQLFAFAYIAFLFKWWKQEMWRDWYIAVCILGLALLTKSNAIPYLAISGLCLLAKVPMRSKKFCRIALRSFLLLFLLTGWLYIYRFVVEDEQHIVGNISGNNHLLMTAVGVENFIIFRPHKIVEYPYNSPWVDTYGRNRFWEHLLKSAFTGEWNFGGVIHTLARVLHSVNFILLPVAVFSMFYDIWKHRIQHLPIFLSFWIPVASVIAILINTSVGGFQDFRYVNIIAIPVTYYVVHSMTLFHQCLSKMLIALLGIFIFVCLILLYFLTFVV